MKTYKLHFIRHGITSGNKDGRYVGQVDMPLCEEGVYEINRIIADFDYPYVDCIYTSPLCRCRQTADLIYPDVEQIVIDELKEIDFGDFEGKSYQDLECNESFKNWIGSSTSFAPPNGESSADFMSRLIIGVQKIFDDMMNNQIDSAAVFTHGGVIMALLAALGQPKHTMQEWMTDNARGYTILMTPQMWMRDQTFEVYDVIPKQHEDDDEYVYEG